MKAVPASRYVVFFSLAVGGCLADLVTKSWMFQQLGMPHEQPVWWIIPRVFGFQTSLNHGALFGMGQGLSLLFAGLSVVAAIGVLVWLFYYGAAADWLLTVALGLVSAGIFGNLYDRLGLWAWEMGLEEPICAVRDFILVMIGRWPWPTFNIADSLLVCGAGLLLYHAFTAQPEDGQPTRDGENGDDRRS